MPAVAVVVLCGLPGSGKSTLASQACATAVAYNVSATVISFDRILASSSSSSPSSPSAAAAASRASSSASDREQQSYARHRRLALAQIAAELEAGKTKETEASDADSQCVERRSYL
jgi:predicted kinase